LFDWYVYAQQWQASRCHSTHFPTVYFSQENLTAESFSSFIFPRLTRPSSQETSPCSFLNHNPWSIGSRSPDSENSNPRHLIRKICRKSRIMSCFVVSVWYFVFWIYCLCFGILSFLSLHTLPSLLACLR
jgi:hypothetical protein